MQVCAFEQVVTVYLGHSHAVAMSSGTAALYTTLKALGIGPGDDVVIPAYVCAAPLHAVRMTGARAVLADCGVNGVHVDAVTVRAALTPATRAVIVSHMFGGTADIAPIIALGVPVIEDIAMSIGASRDGRKAGNMGSVAAVCSFYATKMIAAGEGGMVLTNDGALAERVRRMIAYDNTCDDLPRFNFKLTDIAAALGLSQFGRLETMIERRCELAQRYTTALASCGLELPAERPGERHVRYRYVVGADDVTRLRESLKERGIIAERPVYAPLSRFPGIETDCPQAEAIWKRLLSIPLYPALTDSEAERVVTAVREAVK